MNRYSVVLCVIIVSCTGLIVNGQKYAYMAGHATKVTLAGINDATKKEVFENNTQEFLDAINTAYRTNQPSPTLPKGIADSPVNKTIGSLWAVSPFLSALTEVVENVSAIEGTESFEVRNIQVVIEKADSSYQQQDAVILFDSNGKIIDFKIALGFHSISNILRAQKGVTDLRRRQMIISFIEDFRTAYNIKDLDFLDKVFSDKAVIISGKVLHKTLDGEVKPIVEYKRQTKTEYLSALKKLFTNAKMININFDSISVVQHPTNPDLYGVTLTQTWNTKSLGGNYSDVGYIFLVIDYSKEVNPKIWVRTWQDKKYISEDHGVFSFNHFNIK